MEVWKEGKNARFVQTDCHTWPDYRFILDKHRGYRSDKEPLRRHLLSSWIVVQCETFFGSPSIELTGERFG